MTNTFNLFRHEITVFCRPLPSRESPSLQDSDSNVNASRLISVNPGLLSNPLHSDTDCYSLIIPQSCDVLFAKQQRRRFTSSLGLQVPPGLTCRILRIMTSKCRNESASSVSNVSREFLVFIGNFSQFVFVADGSRLSHFRAASTFVFLFNIPHRSTM